MRRRRYSVLGESPKPGPDAESAGSTAELILRRFEARASEILLLLACKVACRAAWSTLLGDFALTDTDGGGERTASELAAGSPMPVFTLT